MIDVPENVSPELRSTVEAWIAQDPDPSTRSDLQDMLDGDSDELESLFAGRIGFGTAGLRSKEMAGPNGMNRLVVRQTTAGLMDWLDDDPLVVIGYDARHGSAAFASDVARVVAAYGGRAELIGAPLPTPVLARAVLTRSADAGVMITASHNPPQDNGYKLYLADGIQLVSPADAEIAAAIDEAAARPVLVAPEGDERITVLGSDVVDDHLEGCVGVLVGSARDLSVVYTAMHGVGGEHLCSAFELAGFERPHVVVEQFDPDPEFSTVAFPNPEEPGALDLALALAARVGADLLIANDPDADRLALAAPLASGEWRSLSGDQVGLLLGDYLMAQGSGPNRLLSSSIVSSQMLGALARHRGVHHVETLTGFKWVARPIVDRPEYEFVLGYEEALGYCVGSGVRDKDGISAALVAAEMVAVLRAEGRTVWDQLEVLAGEIGVFVTGPVTVRFSEIERRVTLMNQVLTDPPQTLAGASLVSIEDLSEGKSLPPTTGAVLRYDDKTRIIIRPSGTEPKLKAYLEVQAAVEPGHNTAAVQERAAARLADIQAALGDYLGV